MDENDPWLIVLVKPCRLYQKAIRKQICITCKAQTCLGQSQKACKLQLGPLVKPKLAGGNQKGLQATIGWRPSCFEKGALLDG
jgi:hypothetical protein